MGGQIVVPTPGSVLQGPIFSVFEPQAALIQGVTTSVNAVVTTTTAQMYQTGMFMRVLVPEQYGMEVNAQTQIVVTSPTTFTTQLDTTALDPFVAPSLFPPVAFTPAQVVPITGVEMNIA
jgi:hypothetical protein